MKKNIINLVTILLIIMFSLFLQPNEQKVFAQSGISESFENGFGGWYADHYLNCENQPVPCAPLDWSVERSQNQANDGITSLKYYLNGDHDDGQIWIEKSFEIPADQKIRIDVSFDFWSANVSETNRWATMVYMGETNPETWSRQDPDWALTDDTNQVSGWKTYNYSKEITTKSSNLWVGIGLWAHWEAARTYYLDNVSVDISSASVPVFHLNKSVSATTANHGDTIFYNIYYNNSQAVERVMVSDIIPVGTTYMSGSASNGGELIGDRIVWNLGSLQPGQTGNLYFSAMVH